MKLNPEMVISRHHYQLLLYGEPPVLAVQDLKSGNRTLVNQKELIPYEPTPLSAGDTIPLGLSAWGVNYVFRGGAMSDALFQRLTGLRFDIHWQQPKRRAHGH